MEHAPAVQFKTSNSAGTLKLLDAIDHAKTAFAAMTNLKVDAVSRCERTPDGQWHIFLDAIESHARMGDNDLLVTYEVELNDTGDATKFARVRRYHREDRDQS